MGFGKMKSIKTEDMNWPDIKTAIESGYKTLVVAVGSIEQHGPHLPTKTDSLIGEIFVEKIVEKLGNALQGPTITLGCSPHHLAFPGTVSLSSSTLKAIIEDYVDSVVKHGFANIVFIPSHGGNFKTIEETVKTLQKKYAEINVIGYTDLVNYIKVTNKFSIDVGIASEDAGAHAGETETSIMLALAEELVQKDRFAPGYTSKFGSEEIKIVLEKGIKTLTEIGVLGNPIKSDAKRGLIYIEKTTDFLVSEIKKML